MPEASPQLVPAVDRAIRMLADLGPRREGRSISDLARDLEIPKSSAFQIATTLVYHGVLECDAETRRYRLGPALGAIAGSQQGRRDLPLLAAPHLQHLAARVGLTALLGVPTSQGIVLAARADTPEGLGVAAPVGYELDRWAGAFGKVFAASLPPDTLSELMADGLPSFTDRSIVDDQEMRRELDRVARNGVAWDHEEYLEGIRAVAAPVVDRSFTVGAICVLGVSPRLKRNRQADISKAVREAAAALSADLEPLTSNRSEA